jgi:hypothetical protein
VERLGINEPDRALMMLSAKTTGVIHAIQTSEVTRVPRT